MNTVELFNLNQIENIDQLYAHKNDNQQRELLVEHLYKTHYYFDFLRKEKNLESIFSKLGTNFFKDDLNAIKIWKELYFNAIYLHDIGKINLNFQSVKMDNDIILQKSDIANVNTNHSMLSAIIYYTHYLYKITNVNDIKTQNLLSTFLILNSYIISKHHGHFDSLEEFLYKFEAGFKKYRNIPLPVDYEINFEKGIKQAGKIFGGIKKIITPIGSDVFIYVRLLYSCLCTADYYATSEFVNDKKIENLGTIKDVSKYQSLYQKGGIYESIKHHLQQFYPLSSMENVTDINMLRSELFLEAEKNLLLNLKSNLYYLEAPTGGGKTNISIRLAFKLIENSPNLNKVIYVFPFNTLVEQTYKTLIKHFDLPEDIAVLNSITPMLERKEKGENEELNTDYEQTLLDRQFLHYPMVITSHVNFFSYLFGIRKDSIFALAHLANSVVILDEIQSYRNLIWKEIIHFLEKYADVLNIKIIIMSATMPRLGQLTGHELPSLISNRERYFNHPLFKNRVNFDFSLLEKQDLSLEDLLFKVMEVFEQHGGKILIEFITKKSATEFFKRIKVELESIEIELLTGDDHKAERGRIITKVNNENEILLVSTQVVEAGVDIDMDIGFKNISVLDAEEQFAGRINRSCEKTGSKVYYFELDKLSTVYKGDLRVNRLKDFSLRNPVFQKLLIEKGFPEFYDLIFSTIEQVTTLQNDRNFETFLNEGLYSLNFLKVEERMHLIEKKDYEVTIFINRTIQIESGEKVFGVDIWSEYKNLIEEKKLSFSERKVKLARLNEKMNYFLYRINKIPDYQDKVGEIYYIDKDERYFIEGKFNREAFTVPGFT